MSDSGDLRRGISLRSATALVIANVIGAGIFTTTGYQASALGDPAGIFALWIVGGLLAWCGALCYGELGAAMPEAGAEYVYLRQKPTGERSASRVRSSPSWPAFRRRSQPH